MPELVPARIRREAQGIGEAGAEPACDTAQGVFGYFFRSEKVTRRPQAGESFRFDPMHTYRHNTHRSRGSWRGARRCGNTIQGFQPMPTITLIAAIDRSEERRVGKECVST